MVYNQISSHIVLLLRDVVLTAVSYDIEFLDETVGRGVLPTAITLNILVGTVIDYWALPCFFGH